MKLTHILAAALALTTLGTAPATAQTSQDDARFAQAQERFDREYQIYRQEADRYRAAHSGYRGTPGYDAQPGYDGSGYRTAPDVYRNGGAYPDERDEGDYDPARYYRSGPNYQERVLSSDERVYAGANGRYYCKRSDGTTGLIVGAAGGGILGNVIDGGRSRTVGTLLGAAVGGLAGRAVDQNNSQIRCR